MNGNLRRGYSVILVASTAAVVAVVVVVVEGALVVCVADADRDWIIDPTKILKFSRKVNAVNPLKWP